MQNHPNKKKQKFWGSWKCNILLVLVCILAIYSVIGSISKYTLAREKYKNSKEELEKLEANKDKLESSLTVLSTDFGEEQVIRDKFNVVREGEGLIVIIDEKESASSASQIGSGFASFWRSLFD